MAILVTGGSGFLGTALIPKLLKQGHKVYSLSRHPPEARENLVPIEGDILLTDLGLVEVPRDIHALHHLAAIHRLGEDKDGEIWKTNVLGTENVIDFCTRYKIPHLYFTSTAYTQGRNTYERSKALCETMISESAIPMVTIFKPSIIMGTPQHFYPGHFSQFVALVIKIHQRAEVVRRKIEGSLRLPVLEPVFRMRANPKGKINLIQIDEVAKAMAEIYKPGTYWLTHSAPPTLEQLVDWVGEFIMVKIKLESAFKPSPIEIMFEKMSAAFTAYLWGDDFPSDLKNCPPITREFIDDTIKRTILSNA
ncbi:MAG TPA: SDR family oxidoreductase [Dehalococcoidales bacterium]|nr:SDR family oxidoreductase [Dehalococcoidales bacterium]